MRTFPGVSGENISFSSLNVLKILSAIKVDAQSYGTQRFLQAIFEFWLDSERKKA
jgi:hypothetical protein